MSYIEAEAGSEHEEFHLKVIQSANFYQRRVEMKLLPRGEYVFISDALADIIVRGIRSLEEERIGTLSRGVSQGPLPEDWQDDDMGGRCGYGDD